MAERIDMEVKDPLEGFRFHEELIVAKREIAELYHPAIDVKVYRTFVENPPSDIDTTARAYRDRETEAEVKGIGTLQRISKLPLASVYMDSGSRSLYLFVRVNSLRDATPVFVATDTTAENLLKYLNRRIVLRTMFAKKHREYAELIDGKMRRVYYDDSDATEVRLKKAGRFEPELCNNRVELEHFFSNYNQ